MPHERLYRSRTDRVLFGVAGGMADWLDQDPAVVRLVWALLVVFGGAGLILYIIAAIVIPEEPYEMASMPPTAQPGSDATGAPNAGAPMGTSPAGTAAASSQGYPQSRAERRAARRATRGPSSGGIVLGLLLILVGGWFLLRDVFPWIDEQLFGPGILIAIGALLDVMALRRPTPPPGA
jgi:phage shock protein C